MPRRPKLPPNLHRKRERNNIYFKFEIDGVPYQGSTHTSDELDAQDYLNKRVEKAWRDIRLGIKEKRDIPFSEAFEVAADVNKWRDDLLANYTDHRNAILGAYGEFKISGIDRTFSSKYEKKRQAVATAKGRKPYSLVTINHELALIQRVLHALDEDMYVLPKKVSSRPGSIATYPVLPFKVDEAVAQPNNVLKDIDELMSLIDAIVPHARPIVFIAAMTGLRKGNVLDIDVEKVDLNRGHITVKQKGGRKHTVRIHQALYPLIEGLIDGRSRGPLFQYGMYDCDCRFCSDFRKPATSGKAHYVTGLDRKGTHRRIRCIETGEVFRNQTDARNKLVRRDHLPVGGAANIGEVCRGTRKHAGGLSFEFLPTPEPKPTPNKSRRHGKIHSIEAAFRTARSKIGRPDVRFHDLRHTIATWLTEGGMPLSVVAKHLGHKDVAVTQRYAHADTQMVGAFLNDIITIEIPAKPEQNGNNSVAKTLPKTEGSPSVRSTRGVTR